MIFWTNDYVKILYIFFKRPNVSNRGILGENDDILSQEGWKWNQGIILVIETMNSKPIKFSIKLTNVIIWMAGD